GDAGGGDGGREEVEHRGSGRPLFLQPLVALDSAVVLVFGLAFFPGQLDAVDAAVALVQHVQVVDEAAEGADAARRIRADAVIRHGYELLVLPEGGSGDREDEAEGGAHEENGMAGESCGSCHFQVPPLDSYGVSKSFFMEESQWGNGQRRSFSLPICQSRASPWGSRTRKRMISAPKTIISRLQPRLWPRPPEKKAWAERFKKIGTSPMTPAPRKEPRMLPIPPMITMNRIWKDRFRSKAWGSTEPR